MSMFKPMTITCPNCEHVFDMDVVESVNADRRPDLREAILDGTFQTQPCPNCDEEFRIDPQFNYLDMGRGQWISAQPLSELANWIDHEAKALEIFANAYGAQAPGPAREIGDSLSPRLVFGWAALREKLLLVDAGIDDATLELAKLAVVRGFGGAPIQPGVEFRLIGAYEENMDMSWIDARSEKVVEALSVPNSLLKSIEKETETWAAFRAQLTDGPFLDVQKLWIGDGRDAA